MRGGAGGASSAGRGGLGGAGSRAGPRRAGRGGAGRVRSPAAPAGVARSWPAFSCRRGESAPAPAPGLAEPDPGAPGSRSPERRLGQATRAPGGGRDTSSRLPARPPRAADAPGQGGVPVRCPGAAVGRRGAAAVRCHQPRSPAARGQRAGARQGDPESSSPPLALSNRAGA